MRQLLSTMVLAVFLATAFQVSAQALHDLHQGAGVPCTACHVENPPAARTPIETCVACHGTMVGPIEVEPAVPGPDPHRSPHLGPDEVPVCTECHRVHRPSEDTCSVCHRGFLFEME